MCMRMLLRMTTRHTNTQMLLRMTAYVLANFFFPLPRMHKTAASDDRINVRHAVDDCNWQAGFSFSENEEDKIHAQNEMLYKLPLASAIVRYHMHQL